MSQDIKLIQPRLSALMASDGTLVWAMVMRGGGFTNPTRPNFGGGGGQLTKFTISSLNGDYCVAAPVGGGSSVNIAKVEEFRTSLTGETIDSAIITYAWTSDNVRVATDNGTPPNSETQYCTPRYTVGMSIYAMACTPSTGVSAVDSQTTAWIEVLPHRQWGGLN